MLRRVCSVIAVAGLSMFIAMSAGCRSSKEDPSMTSADSGAAYGYNQPADPYPSSAYATPTTTSSDPYAHSGSGGRRHVVQPKETLFSLARTYYGNQSRWRDIYEANRDKISDPNKIRVGQELIIP